MDLPSMPIKIFSSDFFCSLASSFNEGIGKGERERKDPN